MPSDSETSKGIHSDDVLRTNLALLDLIDAYKSSREDDLAQIANLEAALEAEEHARQSWENSHTRLHKTLEDVRKERDDLKQTVARLNQESHFTKGSTLPPASYPSTRQAQTQEQADADSPRQ